MRPSAFSSEQLERRQLLSGSDWDPTFGINGIDALDLHQPRAFQSVIAQQPDGKLVTAGHAHFSGTQEEILIVRRWLTNGQLDPGFGSEGTVRIPHIAFAGGIQINPQGRIVIAGTSLCGPGEVALVQLRGDGTLDSSFGGDGVITRANVPALDNVRGLEMQKDGKLVVMVQSEEGGSILRFNADGGIDNSFSGDGLTTIKIQSDFASFASITLDDQGYIYAAGASTVFTPTGGDGRSLVARLTPAGELDATLDGDGLLSGNVGSGATSVLPLEDGSFLVLGGVFDAAAPANFAIQKVSASGAQLDFNHLDFTRVHNAVSSDWAFRAIPAADGGFMVVGMARRNSVESFIITKINSALDQDKSFGENGFVEIDTANRTPRSVLPLRNGNIALGTDKERVILVDEAGERIPSFGINGQAEPPTAGEVGSFKKILPLADRKYLAVGKTFTLTGGWDYYLARFNPDGSYDNSFGGGDGFVTLGYVGSLHTEVLNDVAVQSDGRIVVAGSVSGPEMNGFIVARFTKNGSLDITFDGDGALQFTQAGAGVANAIGVTPAGKIVVAGTSGAEHAFVQQFSGNGSIDTNFGADGRFENIYFDCSADVMTVQRDGQIVIAGLTERGIRNQLVAFRITPGGSLDRGFGGPYFFQVNSVAALADGTLVFAGSMSGVATARFVSANGMLIREQSFGLPYTGHNSQGFLDATVDTTGRVVLTGRSIVNNQVVMVVRRAFANGAADGNFIHIDQALPFTPTAAAFWDGQPIVAGAFNDSLFLARLRGSAFDTGGIRLDGTQLIVTGTDGKNDTIEVKRAGNKIEVKLNGVKRSCTSSSISDVYVISNGGHDRITLKGSLPRPVVVGDAGNDSILGSTSADYIRGGAGYDTIRGADGNDSLFGDGDKDFIEGNSGNDEIRGGDADDVLHGGTGNDSLYGDAGKDLIFGQSGFDSSDIDSMDLLNSVESILL